MHIEFDPTKDSANQDKHGVSLAMAVELDWGAALVWVDERIEYGEARMIALAPNTGSSTAWLLLIVAGRDASSACAAPIVVRLNIMSKVSKHPSVAMPTVEEDKAITAAARSDPDAQPLTPKQLKSMVPLRTLRGRPKSGNKKLLVSVRYSPEVVAYFKSTGDGWQSRMDEALREYVEQHRAA